MNIEQFALGRDQVIFGEAIELIRNGHNYALFSCNLNLEKLRIQSCDLICKVVLVRFLPL